MYIPKSPFVLCIELTTMCNLNCPHCLADADSKGRSLPYDTTISIINEAERMGVKELVFGGGEALLYSGFFELCEYALSKGFSLSFASNGILIPENINNIATLNKYDNSLRVGISLDGYTSDIHGSLRPKETFDPAIDAIRLLYKYDIITHILCVINKTNINTISEYLEFVSDLGISDVRFIPLMPVGRGKQFKKYMPSPDELYTIIKDKPKFSKEFKINIGIHMPWEFLFASPEKRNPAPCEAAYLRLWIYSNGDISPCAYMSDFSVGNIYRDSVSDVWLNSPVLNKLRDPTLLKGACSSCIYRDGCRGGCRGLASFLEGDYLCPDPYCPIVNQK